LDIPWGLFYFFLAPLGNIGGFLFKGFQMAFSYVRYTANGSTTNYTFAFPAIVPEHIKVRVNGVLTTLFTFLNSSTVKMNVAPAAGVILDIRRETPKDQVIVDFTDGSVLLERDLDLLGTYSLYLAQETEDALDDSITQDYLGVFQGQSKRIANVATPVESNDAVNKSYADAVVIQVAGSATSALESKEAALVSENNAAALYDAFDDRYLGAKSAAPTLDNDGSALLVGALYYDTALFSMQVWNGSDWKPIGSGGATGTLGNNAFLENEYVVTQSYTLSEGKNAGSFGPITVNSGVVVTSPSGSTWTIV
jgi:hypothetical protein